jgi:hypothetical protein
VDLDFITFIPGSFTELAYPQTERVILGALILNEQKIDRYLDVFLVSM